MLFFSLPFFLLPSHAIPLYHPYCKVVCLNPADPFWARHLFSSQWPSTAIGSFITSLAGSYTHLFSLGRLGPVFSPWVSSAFFLTLYSHGLLLNSLGFPSPITLSLILGVHGFAINPILSLLSLLLVCRNPFLLFHIIYCPWFAFSLFPDSFKLIYLLKAHLFILGACDPLFLPLGLNGFFIYLPTLFYLCCWASFFPLRLSKTAINI